MLALLVAWRMRYPLWGPATGLRYWLVETLSGIYSHLSVGILKPFGVHASVGKIGYIYRIFLPSHRICPGHWDVGLSGFAALLVLFGVLVAVSPRRWGWARWTAAFSAGVVLVIGINAFRLTLSAALMERMGAVRTGTWGAYLGGALYAVAFGGFFFLLQRSLKKGPVHGNG